MPNTTHARLACRRRLEAAVAAVAACVAAVCLPAAAAQAVDLTSASSQQALAIARAHWPTLACEPTYLPVAEPELRAMFPKLPDAIGVAGINGAGFSDCRVWIDNDYDFDPAELCTLAEHELGHLTGLHHSSDPHDLMYPTIGYVTDDCAALEPQVTQPQPPPASTATTDPDPDAGPLADTDPAAPIRRPSRKTRRQRPVPFENGARAHAGSFETATRKHHHR